MYSPLLRPGWLVIWLEEGGYFLVVFACLLGPVPLGRHCSRATVTNRRREKNHYSHAPTLVRVRFPFRDTVAARCLELLLSVGVQRGMQQQGPVVSGVSPNEGPPGTRLTIRGENLGESKRDIIGLLTEL